MSKPVSDFLLHQWFESTAGDFLLSGMDVIRPLRTKLYCSGIFSFIKLFIFVIFFNVKFRHVSGGSALKSVFFYSRRYLKQRSTAEMVSVFQECSKENVSVIQIDECFDFLFAAKKICVFLAFYRRFFSSNQAFFIALSYAKASVDLPLIESLVISLAPSKVVTFCDSIGSENLLAQYANQQEITTYTLQHGQYRQLNEHNCSPDIEAVYNFVSDYMLCWGRATIDEYVKLDFSEDRFISVGRFLKRHPSTSCQSGDATQCFGLVLSGNNCKADNIRLIEFANWFAQKQSLRFIVKTHPSNDISDYSPYLGEHFSGVFREGDYYASVQFSIMGMTGFFLECISFHHPFFVCALPGLPEVFSESLPTLWYDRDTDIDDSAHWDFAALQLYFDSFGQQQLMIDNEFTEV